ncbi:hypothetical protein [Ruegeria arenilitoris]|uniref:hypothetical protein n=1 Tax=Ruegeria arenilitoris TaxID=1173585 RepID=UPI00147E27D4|nr:hypothetical protein [Ruegeria arenilitoris]
MQVAIHAGVAFTDEGQIFELFKANADLLKKNRITFMGFPAYRRQFRAALKSLKAGSEESIREVFLQNLANRGPVDRIVLSTPQFIGELPTAIMDGQFYPNAGRRIAYLGDVFEGMKVELFVALRNPGSFIPHVLMSLPDTDRRRILEETDLSSLSWLALIDNIRNFVPDVNITLWNDESSPLIQGYLARVIAGLPEDAALNQEYSLLSSLVSETGQQEIQTLMETKYAPNSSKLLADLGDIFEKYSLPEAVEEELDLPGWNHELIEAFTELYEQDLAILRKMPEIRFIAP